MSMPKTFAEILNEHTKYYKELANRAQKLIDQAKEGDDAKKGEQLLSEAEKLLETIHSATEKFEAEHGDELAALISYVDTEEKRRELQEQVETPNVSSMTEPELYLNAGEQITRHIICVNCEDEACGFYVEFKHHNCTFFFCKEHGTGINIALSTVSDAGVVCELHGKMERYDLMKDDNMCPRCGNSTLAVLSSGTDKSDPQIFASDTERVDYRATFTQCPDCKGTNLDTNFSKCVHCNDCAWAACTYLDPELEEFARARGIELHYEPRVKNERHQS